MREQYTMLSSKLRGHYQYYGIRSNHVCLRVYSEQVQRAWRSWLGRRGGKKRMTFQRFAQLLLVFPLPPPRIVHQI